MTKAAGASDFQRLNALLAKLSARERTPGEGRKLKGDGAETLLAGLVVEIDETILPRRLTLNAGRHVIHLAVANRRLQALLSPLPEVEGAAALEGKNLPDAEVPEVATLREVLLRAFANLGSVGVSSRRLDVTFNSDIGVPANLLGRAWGVAEVVPQAALPPDELMTSFLSGLADRGAAWLRINGEEVTDQGGAEDRVAALGEQAAIFLDGYFAKFDSLFPADAVACGTVIGPRGSGGESMFFVEIGEESAFVAASLAEIFVIAQHWQALVAE